MLGQIIKSLLGQNVWYSIKLKEIKDIKLDIKVDKTIEIIKDIVDTI